MVRLGDLAQERSGGLEIGIKNRLLDLGMNLERIEDPAGDGGFPLLSAIGSRRAAGTGLRLRGGPSAKRP